VIKHELNIGESYFVQLQTMVSGLAAIIRCLGIMILFVRTVIEYKLMILLLIELLSSISAELTQKNRKSLAYIQVVACRSAINTSKLSLTLNHSEWVSKNYNVEIHHRELNSLVS